MLSDRFSWGTGDDIKFYVGDTKQHLYDCDMLIINTNSKLGMRHTVWNYIKAYSEMKAFGPRGNFAPLEKGFVICTQDGISINHLVLILFSAFFLIILSWRSRHLIKNY